MRAARARYRLFRDEPRVSSRDFFLSDVCGAETCGANTTAQNTESKGSKILWGHNPARERPGCCVVTAYPSPLGTIMRETLKRCTCDCARELIVRSALEPVPLGMQTSCRLRRTTQRRAARFLETPRGAVGSRSRPAPNAVQPARSHRAAPAGNRSRSYAGHLHHGTAGAVARAAAVAAVSMRSCRPERDGGEVEGGGRRPLP